MENKKFWPKVDSYTEPIYTDFVDEDFLNNPMNRLLDEEINTTPLRMLGFCQNYFNFMKQNSYTLEQA